MAFLNVLGKERIERFAFEVVKGHLTDEVRISYARWLPRKITYPPFTDCSSRFFVSQVIHLCNRWCARNVNFGKPGPASKFVCRRKGRDGVLVPRTWADFVEALCDVAQRGAFSINPAATFEHLALAVLCLVYWLKNKGVNFHTARLVKQFTSMLCQAIEVAHPYLPTEANENEGGEGSGEPQPVAVPQPVDDEDPVITDEVGDTIMETEKATSGGRGSRLRSRDLSYEQEMSRGREAKRRYNLRNTLARVERMAKLKEAEDAKWKADNEEEEVTDEDGYANMETEEVTSGSRGPRRSRRLFYEEETSREREAKRRYCLRNTQARVERMAGLKEADDGKRKVDDGVGSSSRASRKKSRK